MLSSKKRFSSRSTYPLARALLLSGEGKGGAWHFCVKEIKKDTHMRAHSHSHVR